MFKQLAASILDSVYHSRCLVCGSEAGFEPFLCRDCYHRLNFFGETPYSLRDRHDSPVTAAAALFEFNTPLKILLHHLKYKQAPYVGTFLGEQTGIFFRESDFASAEALIPIPLHPVKLRDRGYNQAEEITRGITQAMNVPMQTELLQRKRYTQTQTRLGHDARQSNIRGAFSVSGNVASYSYVILVDDVFTTGATTEEAAQILKDAGVQRVDVLTVATPMVNRYIRFHEAIDDHSESEIDEEPTLN